MSSAPVSDMASSFMVKAEVEDAVTPTVVEAINPASSIFLDFMTSRKKKVELEVCSTAGKNPRPMLVNTMSKRVLVAFLN